MAQFSGIVNGRLEHDLVEYPHGSTFETDDEKLFNELRKVHALKLPAEVASPETLQAQITAAQNAQAEAELLRQQVAELQAQLHAVTPAAAATAEADKSGLEHVTGSADAEASEA